MSGPTSSEATTRRLIRQALILLALMTLATFGGPVGIWAVLRGGERAGWPPDRAVEWVTFVAITALVLGLMVAAILLSLGNRRTMDRNRADRAAPEVDPPGS